MQFRSRRSRYELCGDAEIIQELGNGSVIANTLAMAGHNYPLTMQMLSSERPETGERMARPHERNPRRLAEFDPSEIRR